MQRHQGMEENRCILSALEEIGQFISELPELERLLDTLTTSLTETGVFHNLLLALYDERTRQMAIVREAAFYQALAQATDQSGNADGCDVEALISQVVQNGLPLVVPSNAVHQTAGACSAMLYFVPVKLGKKVIAVLGTISAANEKRDMLRRIDTMQPFLGQVAVAVQYARLCEETRKQARTLAQTNAQLTREIAEREQTEKWLKHVINSAQCLLWQAVIEEDDEEFHLKLQPFDSEAAQRFLPLDVSPGESYPQAWYRSKFPEDIARQKEDAAFAVQSGKSSYSHEFRCVDKTGKLRWLTEQVFVEPVDLNRWRLIGVCTDITAYKQIAEKLQQNQNLIQQIIDATPNLLYLYDFVKSRNVYVNRQATSIIGYTPDEVCGMETTFFQAMMHPDDYPKLLAHLVTAKDGEIVETEYRLKHATGEYRWFQGQDMVFSRAPNGLPQLILGTSRDITVAKRAEEALRKSEEKYRSLFEESKDAIYIATRDGTIVDVNPAAQELFSPREILGKNIAALYVNSTDWERFQKTIEKTGAVRDYEVKLRKRDVTVMDCLLTSTVRKSADGSIIGYQGIIRDVTEQKQAAAQLAQAARLAAVGELAAGAAHEFLNPLQGIMNAAELLAAEFEPDTENREFAEMILVEGERIVKVIRNLLVFSRQDNEQPTEEALGNIIERAVALIRKPLQRSDIRLRVDIPTDLPLLRCRPSQLQQVVLNLVLNSRDALNIRYPKAHPDKILSISASCQNREQNVRLTIEDLGCGITTENMPRLFDPFFTTKPPDKGTGLGLSISRELVSAHGGLISVECELGKFTRFHVNLPLHTEKRKGVRSQ